MITIRRASLLLALSGLLFAAGLGDAPAQTKSKTAPPPKTAEPPATVATLTFEVYKDSGGKFRWRLSDAADTHLAMANKGYETKAECLKIIDAIKAGAAKAKVEDTAK